MYKRDRALKQQKRALIRASTFKLEPNPPLVPSSQAEYPFPSSVSGLLPPLGPPDYDCPPACPPSLGVALHSYGSFPAQYQYATPTLPGRSIKAEHPDPYSGSPDSSSLGYPYTEGCIPASPQTSPLNPAAPSLVMELLSCEPDEEQVLSIELCHHKLQKWLVKSHTRVLQFEHKSSTPASLHVYYLKAEAHRSFNIFNIGHELQVLIPDPI